MSFVDQPARRRRLNLKRSFASLPASVSESVQSGCSRVRLATHPDHQLDIGPNQLNSQRSTSRVPLRVAETLPVQALGISPGQRRGPPLPGEEFEIRTRTEDVALVHEHLERPFVDLDGMACRFDHHGIR